MLLNTRENSDSARLGKVPNLTKVLTGSTSSPKIESLVPWDKEPNNSWRGMIKFLGCHVQSFTDRHHKNNLFARGNNYRVYTICRLVLLL